MSATDAETKQPTRLLATTPVTYAAKALAVSSALQCSARYAMVSVNAAAMKTPCRTRNAAKVARSGAMASSDVGIASKAKLTR